MCKNSIVLSWHNPPPSFYKNFHLCKIDIIKSLNMGGEKMNNALENFDFLELGQAIQDAHEKQRITREELAEELGISARHLQSVEKEGQYPSFRLFIQLVTMFHISVDQ